MLKSLPIKQLCYGAMNLKFSSVPGTLLVISWHQGRFFKRASRCWVFSLVLDRIYCFAEASFELLTLESWD